MDKVANSYLPFLAAVSAPAWLALPDGSFLQGNTAFAQEIGREGLGTIGLTAEDFLDPSSRMALSHLCQGLASAQDRRRVSVVLRTGGGRERRHTVQIAPVVADGQVAAVLCELRTAAAALPGLASTETDFAAIFQGAAEAAGIGFWTFNPASGKFRPAAGLSAMLVGDGADVGPGEIAWLGGRIYEADRAAASAQLNALARGDVEAVVMECRLTCGDGSLRWFEIAGRNFGTDSRGVQQVCGVATDISHRKKAKERLSQALAEAQHARGEAEAAQAALEEYLDIQRVAWENGRVVPFYAIPRTGAEGFGANLALLLGHADGRVFDTVALRAAMHPEDAGRVLAAYRALLAGERDEMSEDFRLRRADGGWCWVTSKARWLLRGDRGQPDMICGSLVDISALKEHETQLGDALAAAEYARERAQTREDLLRLSGDSGGIAHWIVCPERGDGWSPDSTYRMMGYEPNAFASSDAGWRSIIHPDDIGAAIAAMSALANDEADTYEVEQRLRHQDGSYHWYRTVARKIDRSDKGLPFLLAGANVSVDHVKENEAKLAEAAETARRARARLNSLADNAPGALFEYRQSADGTVCLPYFSAKLPDLLGVPRAELTGAGHAAFANVQGDDMVLLLDGMAAARRDWQAFECRLRIDHPERGMRWLVLKALPYQRQDAEVIWSCNIFDVTEELATERRAAQAAEEVRRAHNRLRMIADIAPVGLFEFRQHTDGTADFPYTSSRFDALVGFAQDGHAGTQPPVFDRIDPRDIGSFQAAVERSAATLEPWNARFRLRHPEKGLIWLQGAAVPRRDADAAIVWTGALHDVTGDVEREAELRQAHRLAEEMRAENERQALHDGLTGLPNRRYYDLQIAERIRLADTAARHDCLLIRIDLDHFKYVNDTLGHEAGDQVLIRVAKVLQEHLRVGDFAARIGGDEYSVILCPGTTPEQAADIVARIQTQIAEPLLYEGRQCRFGASFGIAHAEDLRPVGAEIQIFADEALYRAKAGGRNRMEFFTPELHQNILDDRQLATEIQEGLEHDQFLPFFQPQIDARTGALAGIEALLRWRHPIRGLVEPRAFMHVAEQLRVVPEFDRVIMEKSRGSLDRWRERGLVIPKISFNVSSGRIHDPDVVSAARGLLEGETAVVFELLESILVEEESDAFKFHLDLVREAGIGIEIDDFGSGHASIVGLMQIAPNALKIDRRIVMPVARDPRARNLVRAIVEIAETLDIGTIAEGVETEEQAQVLREVGCDLLQGYLYARPLSEEDLFRFCSGAIMLPQPLRRA